MPVRLDDAAAVADALRALLRDVVPGSSLGFGPTPLTGGFDTYIYAFSLVSPPDPGWAGELVLRLYPSPDRRDVARREYEVQRFCVERGYPAAPPLMVGDEGLPFGVPYMVMRRAPGSTMLAAVSRRPWRAGALMRQLGSLHHDLHALDISDLALPATPALVERRLARLRDRTAGLHEPYPSAIAWLELRRGLVAHEQPVLGHNDFHPMNVLVDDDTTATVIDWGDAALGDRHHDVARTLVVFTVAPLAATSAVERLVLRLARRWLSRAYRNGYTSRGSLDNERLRYWMALHALEGAAQVDLLHTGAFDGDTREDSIRRVPPTLSGELLRLFDRLTGWHDTDTRAESLPVAGD